MRPRQRRCGTTSSNGNSTAGGYLIPANINYLDGYGLGVRGIKTTSAMNCNNFDFASAWLDRLST